MTWIIYHPIVSISYGLLYLSVLLLWVPSKRKIPNWSVTLFLSIILGLISHQLEMMAVIPIIISMGVIYYSQTHNSHTALRMMARIGVVVLGVALMAHSVPGFHNLKVLDNVHFSKNAIPFSLYLNFDKTIFGIFILGFGAQLISNKNEWLQLCRQIAVKAPIVILILIAMAFAWGFVNIDFKISNNLFIWALTNLLFVCMAEEAFFRGFIQGQLSWLMRKIRYGDYYAILISAIFFGLVHYPGGVKYMILATVAGLGYGWVYTSTKRIEGSILTHVGLNLTHFIFFTYPALAATS